MFKKTDVKDIYGLTPMQEGMLMHYQLDTTRSSYFEQAVVSLEGEIDVRLFERAFQLLVQKHDILRTVFLYRKVKKPVQVVLKKRTVTIEFSDVSSMEPHRASEHVEDFLAQDRTRGFNIEKDTLLRLGLIQLSSRSWKAVFTNHHLIMDGWCLGLIFKDFIGFYTSLASGQEVNVLAGIPFSRYVKWLEGLDPQEGLRFWREGLLDYQGAADFSATDIQSAKREFRTAEYAFELEDRLSGALIELAKTCNATVSALFQCILGVLLMRFNNTFDVVFGNVVSGRPPEIDDVEDIIGLFVNTVPLRIHSEPGESFGQLLEKVHRRNGEAKPHEYVPLAEIQSLMSQKQGLVRVIFGFQNYPLDRQIQDACRQDLSGISVTDIQGFEQIGNDFNCIVSPGSRINIRFNYNANVYPDTLVRRIAGAMSAVAGHVVRDPERPVSAIPLFEDEELKALVQQWNGPKRGYDLHLPMHDVIQARIKECPDGLAVAGQSLGAPGNLSPSFNQFTYQFLWNQSGTLAGYLSTEICLQSQEPVAIMLEPAVERVVALLGILRAGGAFVPIDPALPPNRIRFMLDDAAIRVVISQKKFIGLLNRLQWDCPSFDTFICLDSRNVYQEIETDGNRLMDRELWEYVGETAVDHITGGGWQSSYTGEPFSSEEMDEYGNNILRKLEPLLHQDMRILEIGCASGITMYRLAPKISLYYGVDLSRAIIQWNRKEVKRRGLTNIRLASLAAHEIGGLDEGDFDLIIINSVIQCFHGHNYLRRVLGLCVDKLKDSGRIFIGDVMDLDGKEELLADLRNFSRQHPEYKGKTKTDFSDELFLSRRFFDDLQFLYPQIQSIQHSGKIFTIKNELTRFRYDTVLTVQRGLTPGNERPSARKRQHDLRALEAGGGAFAGPSVEAGDLAYVIYTSGSTGRPKGVMVEHRSLVNLCHWHRESFSITARDHASQYAGFGFDAAVWEVFPYLAAGAALFLIPTVLKLEIRKLNLFFHQHDITVAFFPTQFCEQFQEMENRSLRAILTGGDKLNRYIPKDYRLFNNYGPTENTVVTTSFPVDRHWENIPVGTPMSNVSVYIMARDTSQPQPDGAMGEICIGGDGLARGYMNRPELTAEKFCRVPYPGNASESIRIYRSGDLGRRLDRGAIEFHGRVDHQVKIRGLRIELGEIENRLLRFEGVAAACVTIQEAGDDGDKLIVAYLASRAGEEISPDQVSEFLLEDLPSYMVPSDYVFLEELPLTANGKVDRNALPASGASPERRVCQPPVTLTETKVRSIWAEVLAKDEHSIGVTDSFFEHGGHSLKATAIVSRFRMQLQVEFPLHHVFDSPTVRQMAEIIDAEAKSEFQGIQPVEEKEYYPQSSAQKRLFFLEQFDTTGTSYNIPDLYRMTGRLDREMFQRAFDHLIARHDALRTSFALKQGEPVQIVQPAASLTIQYLDWRERQEDLNQFMKSFVQPFELSRAPLLRVVLIRRRQDEWLLAMDMHHIIGDGSTMGILIEDFIRFYKGEKLPALKLQYRDYAVWQDRLHRSGAMDKQLNYWQSRFDGDIPRLELPLDFPRPAVFDFSGRTVNWSLGLEESRQLRDFSNSEGASLYMTLLAVFAAVLYHWSGQEDIVVGSGVANRRHTDLERIAGMMVNSLPLRMAPQGKLAFNQFLQQVKAVALEAFENQDVQFEDLVERLDPERDPSRNPIFDVLLVAQNFQRSNMVMPGVTIEPVNLDTATSKFDITLFCLEGPDQIHLVFEYCTSLFKESTIQRLADDVTHAILRFTRHPCLPLQDLDLSVIRTEWGVGPTAQNTLQVQESWINSEENLDRDDEELILRLTSLFAAVLGSRRNVAPDDNFFKIGGHSLKAVALVSRLHEELEVQVPVSVVFSSPTARKLSRFIRKQRGDAVSPVRPVERKEYYPLSSAQQRMYILQQMMKTRVVYNMPMVFRLRDGALDLGAVEAIFLELIRRHESLRTSFVLIDDEPVQRIWSQVDFQIQEVEDIDSFVRPFDLTRPPLMRVGIVKTAANQWYMVMDMHHIIGDGVSLQVLRREFAQLAAGGTLAPLTIQYKDIAIWQRSAGYQAQLSGQRLYWSRQLAGPLPVLRLPLDFPRPAVQDFRGSTLRFFIGTEERDLLGQLEEQLDLTLFVALSACFHLLLWILSGQSDIVSGFPVAGRRYADMRDVVGMFVNTLALRSRPSPQTTVEEYLNRVKRLVIAAFDNQDVPFEELVENLDIRRDASRNPVFDVMLALQNMADEGEAAAPSATSQEGAADYQNPTSRFDMTWNAVETNGRVYFEIEYCVALFKEDTVRRLAEYYLEVVRTVGRNPGCTLSQLKEHAVREGWDIPQPEKERSPETVPGPEESGRSPAGEVEAKLADIWAAVLSREAGELSAGDDFFSLGGHSLRAVKLTNAIYREFGVEVGIQEIFQAPTIAAQAALISRQQTGDFREIPVLDAAEHYPVSYSQRRIWMLQRMNPGSTVFNMPMTLNLPPGDADLELTRRVIQTLVQRHEALRTSFQEHGDEVVQVIAAEADIPLRKVALAGLGSNNRQTALERLMTEESQAPFDLEKPPLFRATLLDFGNGRSSLLVNMHHIISDGWSMQILQQELVHIYQRTRTGNEDPLPPLRVQYKEFAAWQNKALADPVTLNGALDFWRRNLNGGVPPLELPYDFPEQRRKTSASSGYRRVLSGDVRSALEEIARDHDATLFMVLLAGFQMTLSFIRGADDIILGIPGAARQHDDLKQIIGLFVNTLIVRGQVNGGARFTDFLKTLRDDLFQVLEHQSVPLELIFEKLGLVYPKLSVFFNMVNIGATELLTLGDSIEPSHQERVQDAKFPLTLYLTNCRDGVDIKCHYFNELFLPATIQSIVDLYLYVLRGIAGDPGKILKDYRRQPKKRLARKRSKQE